MPPLFNKMRSSSEKYISFGFFWNFLASIYQLLTNIFASSNRYSEDTIKNEPFLNKNFFPLSK